MGWGLTVDSELRPLLWEKDEAGKYALVNLHDEDSAGYGIAWKVNGNYIAGGIGQGRIWLGQGIANKAVVWWKGTLDVVVDAKGKYESFECASVNRKGAVAGFGIMDDDGDPSTSGDDFPIGFTARK